MQPSAWTLVGRSNNQVCSLLVQQQGKYKTTFMGKDGTSFGKHQKATGPICCALTRHADSSERFPIHKPAHQLFEPSASNSFVCQFNASCTVERSFWWRLAMEEFSSGATTTSRAIEGHAPKKLCLCPTCVESNQKTCRFIHICTYRCVYTYTYTYIYMYICIVAEGLTTVCHPPNVIPDLALGSKLSTRTASCPNSRIMPA